MSTPEPASTRPPKPSEVVLKKHLEYLGRLRDHLCDHGRKLTKMLENHTGHQTIKRDIEVNSFRIEALNYAIKHLKKV